MCAVYFLAIFRRNFNGIIVFYVCIINTNSIHASYPLPSGLWPEGGQWSVSKLTQDTHPQRMPRAMAVIVVGVCECPCLCVCVCVWVCHAYLQECKILLRKFSFGGNACVRLAMGQDRNEAFHTQLHCVSLRRLTATRALTLTRFCCSFSLCICVCMCVYLYLWVRAISVCC